MMHTSSLEASISQSHVVNFEKHVGLVVVYLLSLVTLGFMTTWLN